jgi:DNA-binding transcriptional MerR regulator
VSVTVGKLANRFGLSRSTLLYYDKIGLLKPSGRTAAGYRQYSEADIARLDAIRTYQQAGLTLREIERVLSAPHGELADILERRLTTLNEEIQNLRGQQRFILGVLRSKRAHQRIGVMNKEKWTRLLSAAGFTEEDMRAWHVAFEQSAPEEHQQFLEFLCIPDDLIKTIRGWGAKAARSQRPRTRRGRETREGTVEKRPRRR